LQLSACPKSQSTGIGQHSRQGKEQTTPIMQLMMHMSKLWHDP